MNKLKWSATFFVILGTLSNCSSSMSPYDAQCKRNPAIDGAAITAMTAIPFAVVATTPIGLGIGVLMGGSYYVTHETVCQ